MLSKILFKLVKRQKQIYNVIKTQTNIVVNVRQVMSSTWGSSKIYSTTISLYGYLETYFMNKAEYFRFNRSTCWMGSIWIGYRFIVTQEKFCRCPICVNQLKKYFPYLYSCRKLYCTPHIWTDESIIWKIQDYRFYK